ncbi:MAG: DUF928 domain-containing protein [Richelia sp.]|nr:DUF928 domain-containing protein [Richelia sp.]
MVSNANSSRTYATPLLLPETNVGFTTNSYARFFWYTPDNTAQRVRFSLYQVDEKLRQRKLALLNQGIISLTFQGFLNGFKR